MKTLYFQELTDQTPIRISAHEHTTIAEHKHSFFEFVYVCCGKAEHISDRKTSIVSEGDYFLIDPDISHEYRPISNQIPLRVINCMFLPSVLDQSFGDAKSFRDISGRSSASHSESGRISLPARQIFHDESGLVASLTEHMLREFQDKRPGYEAVLSHLLSALFVQLMRNVTPEENRTGTQMVRNILEYIHQNYMLPLSLSDLCENMHFSLPYVSSVFHRETGMTFRTCLIRTRIEKSCLLLRQTGLTVEEIATRVGYADPAFLYKAFHREMKMTPDEYRRHHQR